ncbi:MAG: endonuclease domain-containing protein [Bacteroidota bacterium]
MSTSKREYQINGVTIKTRTVTIPPATDVQKERARKLRKNRILSEVLFWRMVRNNSFHGINFDRQRCMGKYIVDFYIPAFGVVIELDGASHIGKYDYDKQRDTFLAMLGIHIIHIQSSQVINSPDSVLRFIESILIESYREY